MGSRLRLDERDLDRLVSLMDDGYVEPGPETAGNLGRGRLGRREEPIPLRETGAVADPERRTGQGRTAAEDDLESRAQALARSPSMVQDAVEAKEGQDVDAGIQEETEPREPLPEAPGPPKRTPTPPTPVESV